MSLRHSQLTAILTITTALIAVAVGWAITQYPPTYPLALAGLVAMAAVARWNRGAFAGILILLIINGVPFINTQPAGHHGSGGVYDAVFLILVLFLLVCGSERTHDKPRDRIIMLAFTWAGLYFAWWEFKVFAASPGVPLVPAIKYGRTFLYFIVLLPIALLALRRREHLAGFALTLAAGAGIFSIGQIVKQLTHANLAWLIHLTQENEFEGVARLYAPMNDLVIAMFPMALAALILGPRSWRRLAMVLALLTGFANALSFTRAVYASEIIGILVISFIWAKGFGWQTRRIRYAITITFVAIAAFIAIASGSGATDTTSSSPLQAVVSRAALGVSNVETGEGTAGYRLHEANLDIEVLGDQWFAGLGFLNPAYRYFAGLHEGAIQDDDLGALSVLMTMGFIGLILAYTPLIAGLLYLVRRRYGPVQYGGAMYLTAALVGSITLGAVSTLSGMMVLDSMLVFCVNWTRFTQPEDTALDVKTRLDQARFGMPQLVTQASRPANLPEPFSEIWSTRHTLDNV